MIIRDVRYADFGGILKLYDQGYDEVKENQDFGDILRLKRPTPKAGRRWAKSMYENVMNGHVLFAVAEHNKHVVGFCVIRKREIPDMETSHVGVLTVRVGREMRGHGVGTKLIGYSLRKAKKKFEIVELNVIGINKRAIKLYKRFGFREWGVAPGFVKRGKRRMDLVYMHKKL
jgi:ribosomal protein S18 acetylase RimI-like enzyme